jgi:hypothetical protein
MAIHTEHAARNTHYGNQPMQQAFIHHLTAKASADVHIRAAWLAGSFGAGKADRYSDVDAYLLIAADHVEFFRASARAWREEIRPLVLYTLLFDGQMINALTVDGLRVDIWLYCDDTVELPEGTAQILYAEAGALAWKSAPSPRLTQEEVARQLERLIPEFWRCVAMLPVVLGRQERIVAFTGAAVELQLLTDVLIAGAGVRNDRGAKARNDFLPAELRHAVESALVLPDLNTEALARLHLRLAALMQAHGPSLCAAWNIEYPRSLEEAALNYVKDELALLRLSVSVS